MVTVYKGDSMIILEKIELIFGPNVELKNAKILAHWVEYDDDTGEQESTGEIEVWEEPKDPAKAEELFPGIGSGVVQWEDMSPQIQSAARKLFKQLEKVIENAVIEGRIKPRRLNTENKPEWMNALKND
jgi:hypothetical protein